MTLESQQCGYWRWGLAQPLTATSTSLLEMMMILVKEEVVMELCELLTVLQPTACWSTQPQVMLGPTQTVHHTPLHPLGAELGRESVLTPTASVASGTEVETPRDLGLWEKCRSPCPEVYDW